MKSYIYILVALIFTACSKDNVSKNVFIKYYGGQQNQGGADIIAVGSRFALLGQTTSLNANGQDLYWILTDSAGNELNSRIYPNAGNESGVAILPLLDGSYWLVGNTVQGTNSQFIIMKIASDGTLITSTKPRGGFTGEQLEDAILLDDGGLLLVGTTRNVATAKPNYNAATDFTDILLTRVDANGSAVWNAIYGFPFEDAGVSVMQRGANDFLVLGQVKTTSDSVTRAPILVRYNGGGGLVEQRTYNTFSATLLPQAFIPISNGRIALCALNAISRKPVIGIVSPDLSINAIPREIAVAKQLSSISSIGTTTEEDYILSATSVQSTDNTDINLIKVRSSNFSLSWERRFGGTRKDNAGRFIFSNESTFALVGTVDVTSNKLISFIKTDSKGEIK